MEKGKHQGTRPEMGTPEYEEWRKRMLARRRKRLQRERRKRLIAMGVALVLVIGGVSAGINSCKGKKTSGYPVRIKFCQCRKRIPQKIRRIRRKCCRFQNIRYRRRFSNSEGYTCAGRYPGTAV